MLAAIQKVFAVFYHNTFQKNMPENLEPPGEWKYASEVGFVRLKLRRIVVVRIIFYIFMGCAITSSAFGEDPIQLQLDAFYAEYEAIVANPTIPKYIELDRKWTFYCGCLSDYCRFSQRSFYDCAWTERRKKRLYV